MGVTQIRQPLLMQCSTTESTAHLNRFPTAPGHARRELAFTKWSCSTARSVPPAGGEPAGQRNRKGYRCLGGPSVPACEPRTANRDVLVEGDPLPVRVRGSLARKAER